MAAATLLIFFAVVQRYGMSSAISLSNWGRANEIGWLQSGGRSVFFFLKTFNLTWAQELCIYLFVWMAKFGAAYGVRTGIHVGVDVAVNRLGKRSQSRVILAGLFAGALFTGIVGSLGAQFVWDIAKTDQVSADMELPMWIVYLAVPLGSFLMCFRFLQVAYTFARTGDLPKHDHGHVEGVDQTPVSLSGTLHPAEGAAR